MKQFILTVHGMVTQMTGNLINRMGRQGDVAPSIQLELPLDGYNRGLDSTFGKRRVD